MSFFSELLRSPQSTISIVLILFLLIAQASQAQSANMSKNEEFAQKSAQFAVQMLKILAKEQPTANIIYSPFSIQTCVAMARIGATGETAAELDRGLGLPDMADVAIIANTFHEILAAYEKSNILKIANKIYIMQGINVKKTYNEILTHKFFSTAESINFEQSVQAAGTINRWVESRTNNLIKELISPDALSGDTRAVLLNAIYFKGEWKHQFPKPATKDEDFYLNESDKVKVPMMNIKETFRYADLPDLDATALEMPYKDSDLSMLVILPNSRTGLAALQEKLQKYALSDITKNMYPQKVIVKFPKFKAEFSIELNSALTAMGMGRMFSNRAEFGNILESEEELQVSKVLHKAFIEVNEEGTEAAAATGAIMRKKRSLLNSREPNTFIADHPFLYFITHKMGVSESAESGVADSSVALFTGAVRLLTAVENVSQIEHDEF